MELRGAIGVGEGSGGGSCGGTKKLRRPEYDSHRRGNGGSCSREGSQNTVVELFVNFAPGH